MKNCILHAVLAMGLALVFVGCMTDAERRAERINNNQAIFLQLDSATQSRISQGLISIGDTTQAVWLALGEPEKRTSDTTAAASVEIWQYCDSIPEEYTVLVHDIPPPGHPILSHYETRTRYVKVVSLQIQFDNGRVSRIQQF